MFQRSVLVAGGGKFDFDQENRIRCWKCYTSQNI